MSYNPQSAFFIATSDSTVTNTTNETSVIGGGNGSATLAANILIPSKSIIMYGGGVYSAAAITPGNVLVKVKYGSTVLASGTANSGLFLAGASALGFSFQLIITCRTSGASGSVKVYGGLNFTQSSATGTLGRLDLFNGGSAITIDTTTASLLDVTVTPSVASTSNIIQCTHAILSFLN